MLKTGDEFKRSLFAKLSVFTLSLAVCLAALEGGLRLTGYAVEAGRPHAFVPPYEDRTPDADYVFERYKGRGEAARPILTLGDSLTNAGNVKSYYSYPYYLYERLLKAGRPAPVYNLAKCEESTFGAVGKLRKYLEDPGNPAPSAVVILVGAADLFNLPLVEKRMKTDQAPWHDVFSGGFPYDLRLYKVYRHIAMNLRWRFGLGERDSDGDGASQEERMRVLLEVYAAHKKAKPGAAGKVGPELVSRIREVFSPEEMDYDDLDVSDPADFTSFLADYASVAYSARARYDEFFELLLDMARAFPEDFWKPEFDTASYYLVQTYGLQSRRTALQVLDVLEEAAKQHPALRGNPSFANFRSYLSDRRSMDGYIDGERRKAWEAVAGLAEAGGFRVILQTYPVEYAAANRALKEAAKRHGFVLVDNTQGFAELIRRDGREPYLEDNDHLTPEGYDILAQNVFAALSPS